MKYQVGDKVKIRKDLEAHSTYYMEDGKESNTVTTSMANMRGQIATIEFVGKQYMIKEDESRLGWVDGMFENTSKNNQTNSNYTNNIDRITFNNPATVIHFTDGTKTIVKATENDKYNPTVGFLYAYFEKMSGMSKTQCGKFFDNLEEEYAEQLERKMKKRSKKNK